MLFKLRLSFIFIVIAFLIFLFYKISKNEGSRKALKEDLMELSSIKYGLFNVDEWKNSLVNIISSKIKNFEINNQNKNELKLEIGNFLNKVISDFEKRFYEENSGSLDGFLKNTVANFTGTFSKMKENVPIFTNQIIDFVSDIKNKKALSGFLSQKINEYADETFSETDYANQNFILKKYSSPDRLSAIALLKNQTELLDNKSKMYQNLLLFTTLLFLLLIFSVKELNRFEFLLLSFSSLILLLIGLIYPMIEIDARISFVKFKLLGFYLEFKDQVLFYRSKSVLEVVKIMFSNGEFGLMVIGGMIFLFSVVFPMSKLFFSVLLIFSKRFSSNKTVNFLVFKTGKWSMADVMVVAIFMAYIGFNGILSDQLKQIGGASESLDLITTNQSSLQIGFYSFFSFVVLSLFLSGKIQKFNIKPPVI